MAGSAESTPKAPGGAVAALFGNKGALPMPPPKRPQKRRTVKQLPLDYHDGEMGDDSIWADVSHLNGIEVHRPEIEALFVKTALSPDKRAKKAARPRAAPAASLTVILAPKRSTNVAIALAGAKLDALDLADVRAAVARADAGAFSRPQLEALDAATPTPDEASRLAKCDAGDDDFYGLAEAERFMCRVALPLGDRYAEGVSCLRFRAAFGDRARHLAEKAADLRTGCAGVAGSPRLKKLLTYVLRLGRELDESRGRKGAATDVRGFRLHGLLKLADTKAFDRETSALEYRRPRRNLLARSLTSAGAASAEYPRRGRGDVSTEYPRRGRGDVSTEYPRRGRGAATTRPHGISTSRPRRSREPGPYAPQ